MQNFSVEEKREGRSGWIYYIEQTPLPFFWEILPVGGRSILVPTPGEWDAYCEKHNASWAKGHREEILQQTAKGLIDKAASGYFELEEHWLHVHLIYKSLVAKLIDNFLR